MRYERVCMLLAILMMFASTALLAQDLNSIRFQRYGIENGLSQTTVRTLYQDRQGFVWLGTQDGLNRFDGYEFRVYRNDPAKNTTLGDNHIVAIENSAGKGFWVGTLAGGLALYDPVGDDFKRFQADGKYGDIPNNGISAMLLDSSKNFWVATNIGSLQWWDESQAAFQTVPAVDSDSVGRVKSLMDFDKGLLMGSRNGIFFLANKNAGLLPWPKEAPLAVEIEKIIKSPDGKEVWVATIADGVYRFKASGQLIQHIKCSDGLGDENVRDLKFDRFGRLWIATFNGLSRIDSPNAKIKTWRYNQGQMAGISASRIQSLMEDRDGLMWVGTWLNGVNLYIPRTESFNEITAQSGGAFSLPSSAVPGLFVDKDKTLWLGILEGGGLVHYDLNKGVLARYVNEPEKPDSLPPGIVQTVVRDHQGVFWVATGAGLAKMHADGKSFEIFRNEKDNPDSLPYTPIQTLLVDSKGTLWIGTSGGGLASRCAGCERFIRHSIRGDKNDVGNNATISNDLINRIYEDSQGQIWLGLTPGGLVKLDRNTGVMQRFRADPSNAGFLSHESITTIFQDSQKRMWIGTQGGGLNLMHIDSKGVATFTSFTMKNGLGSNAIVGTLEDARGNLWVSTAAGLSRINPDATEIENFGNRDGAQGTGYFIGSFGQLPDGRMLFGGPRGVTIFNPLDIRAQPAPNGTELTALRVISSHAPNTDVKPFQFIRTPKGGSLELAVGADDLTVEFSALDYADPAALHYAYRMIGISDDWFETDGLRRFASFNNLQPGNYQFEVKAKNPDGRWGNAFQMPIHLPAPWWATFWAKLGFLLLLASAIGIFAWNVLLRLRERERAQAKILESEQQLKLTLWGTGDELWDLDLVQDIIHRSNPLLILKGSTGEISPNARSLMKYVHPDDAAVFEKAIRDHIKGVTEVFDATCRSESVDGGWRWVRMRGRVVERDASGKALRLVGTTGDITDLKQHEIALAQINAQLEQRVAQRTEALSTVNQSLHETIDQLTQTQKQLVESEKLAALGGLVAGVAHEINTPLGIGVTAASFLDAEVKRLEKSLLENTLSKSDLESFSRHASESSQLILRNLYRADKLVKSFKQVSVDQSSQETRVINLQSYVEEVLLSLHPVIKKTSHEVHLYCRQELNFETYPGAIYQILVNLLMNSLLHGFAKVEKGKIDILISQDRNAALIEFRDNGCGMPEDIRSRVFDPFFTTRRGDGGSGLGLHIAWNLATQLLSGSISCESEVGKGTSFYLRIPLQIKHKEQ